MMARWTPDARERLGRAALELFSEQGFAATTVPQITARAGLATRTFFRHFSDKREVFFADDEIPQLATRILREAPTDQEPMTLVINGLRTLADTRFEPRRGDIRVARSIIMSDEGLRERDLRKRAGLYDAIRDGFVARGETPLTAALTAAVTVEVLEISLHLWLSSDETTPLRHYIDQTFAALHTLSSSIPHEQPTPPSNRP